MYCKFLPSAVCARLRDALGAQEGRPGGRRRGELRLLRDGRHLHAKGGYIHNTRTKKKEIRNYAPNAVEGP